MADLNDVEQLQEVLQIVTSDRKATAYFEDLLFNLVNFAKNRMLEGENSPEGVVEAPRRSMYFDTIGQALYYKTTDTGNTGWVPV